MAARTHLYESLASLEQQQRTLMQLRAGLITQRVAAPAPLPVRPPRPSAATQRLLSPALAARKSRSSTC